MALVKYNPFNEFVPVTWNSILDSFFNENNQQTERIFSPTVDILENDKAFEVQVVVPGMKKEDFKIDLKENSLIISGERKWKEEKNEKNFHRLESQYGSFRRSFRLPENIDVAKITASYKEGILSIEIPKDEKKILSTSITIK